MRRRIVAVLLVFLMVGSCVSTSLAELCPREVTITVNKKKFKVACNRELSWVQSGRSVELYGTHQFGGFLGMFTQTCTYTYRDYYSHYQCKRGHVQNMSTTRHEYNHSLCGK